MADPAFLAPVDPFHFAPQSPPGSSSSHANGLPPFPSSLAPPQSQISPSLYSPLASSDSIAQSIAQSLGPRSPFHRPDEAMDGGAADPAGHKTLSGHDGHSSMDLEDELRRGPPASDTPGGDCRNVCIRHARMANGSTNLMLQKVCPVA